MIKKIFLFSAHYGEHMETEVWRAAYPETLGETLGPRFDLVSDLVLVQLEKPTNHKSTVGRQQMKTGCSKATLCLCQEKRATRV